MNPIGWMENTWGDLRHGARLLRFQTQFRESLLRERMIAALSGFFGFIPKFFAPFYASTDPAIR
jgi:hypothetical protein